MLQRLLPRVMAAILRLLGATWRVRVLGADPFEAGELQLAALWHSDSLIGAWRFRDRDVTVPVSFSRDGELFNAALLRMGFGLSARGSTSRGALGLLRQLIRATARGAIVAILPDGPRGPARHAQPGVVAVAATCGVPIYPVALQAQPVWRAGSWDRTQVPLPFARVICCYGEPLHVPKKAGETAREEARRELERRLNALAERVEAELRGS
jgi:lysophospholipid acyltransferase (LPLAT)-like uncharacterized protein